MTSAIEQAYSRRYMLDVCKDGTVSIRDTKDRKAKRLNGAALPVFSVDSREEALRIQIHFCRKAYIEHPEMPGEDWFRLSSFSGAVEDLEDVTKRFAEFYEEMRLKEERLARGYGMSETKIKARKARR